MVVVQNHKRSVFFWIITDVCGGGEAEKDRKCIFEFSLARILNFLVFIGRSHLVPNGDLCELFSLCSISKKDIPDTHAIHVCTVSRADGRHTRVIFWFAIRYHRKYFVCLTKCVYFHMLTSYIYFRNRNDYNPVVWARLSIHKS